MNAERKIINKINDFIISNLNMKTKSKPPKFNNLRGF